MSQFQIQKAVREALNARIGISGASGGGKTYSSIRLARGLVGPNGKIVVLDSEQGSSRMYAGLTDFEVVDLEPPYSPQRYTAAIDFIENYFEQQGIPEKERCLIADQISHAWTGQGGVLEFVDRAKTASGNKAGFNAWKDATPMQHQFVERMLRFKGHLIVTMRTKVEWVVDKDEKGKSTPRKVGMAPIQREGIEYEFQIMLDLSNDTNLASVSKDRTGVLYGTVFQPTEEIGSALAKFLNSGEAVKPRPKQSAPAPAPSTPAPAPVSTPATRSSEEAAQKITDALVPPPPGPDVKVVSEAQAKIIVKACKGRNIKPSGLKAILKLIAGVEDVAKCTADKFLDVLAAISPEDEEKDKTVTH